VGYQQWAAYPLQQRILINPSMNCRFAAVHRLRIPSINPQGNHKMAMSSKTNPQGSMNPETKHQDSGRPAPVRSSGISAYLLGAAILAAAAYLGYSYLPAAVVPTQVNDTTTPISPTTPSTMNSASQATPAAPKIDAANAP
jgi:hypothetical protein